jgi:hypothetical protein
MESVDFKESVGYGVVTVSTVLLSELLPEALQDPIACISSNAITKRMRINLAIRTNL